MACSMRGMLDGGKHKLALGPVDDIPWLKRQTRLTFYRCGIVDPRSPRGLQARIRAISG